MWIIRKHKWYKYKEKWRQLRIEIKVRERERVMVFNVTFNNIWAISWPSVLLVEETGEKGTGCFGHSTSSATLYKDVSAMVLFMLFYELFITILCINNHIEYKNK